MPDSSCLVMKYHFTYIIIKVTVYRVEASIWFLGIQFDILLINIYFLQCSIKISLSQTRRSFLAPLSAFSLHSAIFLCCRSVELPFYKQTKRYFTSVQYPYSSIAEQSATSSSTYESVFKIVELSVHCRTLWGTVLRATLLSQS